MKRQYLYGVTLVVLLGLLLAACASAPLAQPVPEVPDEPLGASQFYAANPELLKVSGSLMDQESVSDSAFYAVNPELMIVARYEAAR